MPRANTTTATALAAVLERRSGPLRRLTGPNLGVDVVSIPRWARRLELGGDALLHRIYTEAELRVAAGRMDRLATRLAAKEAVLKALGTGIRGIALRDVEVRVDRQGKPTIKLGDPAARRASQLGLDGIAVSLCHEGGFAIAIAAGFRAPTPSQRKAGLGRRRSGTASRK
jgi:holo-[acyl-carrier protein] synthase